MSDNRVQEHPLWKVLTPQERNWLAAYLETGDAESAVRASYPGVKDTRSYSRKLLQRPQLQELIAHASGENIPRGDSAEMKRILWEIARDKSSTPASRISACDLIADLEGWRSRSKAVQASDLTSVLQQIERDSYVGS